MRMKTAASLWLAPSNILAWALVVTPARLATKRVKYQQKVMEFYEFPWGSVHKMFKVGFLIDCWRCPGPQSFWLGLRLLMLPTKNLLRKDQVESVHLPIPLCKAQPTWTSMPMRVGVVSGAIWSRWISSGLLQWYLLKGNQILPLKWFSQKSQISDQAISNRNIHPSKCRLDVVNPPRIASI